MLITILVNRIEINVYEINKCTDRSRGWGGGDLAHIGGTTQWIYINFSTLRFTAGSRIDSSLNTTSPFFSDAFPPLTNPAIKLQNLSRFNPGFWIKSIRKSVC